MQRNIQYSWPINTDITQQFGKEKIEKKKLNQNEWQYVLSQSLKIHFL